ncbi:hypothetical protein V500_03359 [Pseudogymnoascus sp. VKM F-4518 (FW-2643)]|nr:hypothetical protein V500_03359 [Pseudogymnoascus sp. VKM F-4518 (FW-2643)]
MSTGVRIVVARATMATLAVPRQMDNKTSVGYGCCPDGTTCNEIGACIETITTTNQAGRSTIISWTVIPGQTIRTDKSPPTQIGTGTGTTTAPTQTPTQTQGISTIGSSTTDSSSQTVVIIGTHSVTLPSVATSTVLTTLGEAFTLIPGTVTDQQPTNILQTTALPSGVTVVSSSNVVVVGSDTVFLPSVGDTSKLTTDGLTFTLVPTSTGTSIGFLETTTAPSGQSFTTSSGLLIWSSFTVAISSSLSSASTLTTDGQTFTFLPTNSLLASESTATLPDGQEVTSTSGLFIWGTNTLSVPTGITTSLIVTTDGETFTFKPIEIDTRTALTGTDTGTTTGPATATGTTTGAGETDIGTDPTGTDTENAPIGTDTGTAPTETDTGNAPTETDAGNSLTETNTETAPTGTDTGNAPTGKDTGNAPTETDTKNVPTETNTGTSPTETNTGNSPTKTDTEKAPTETETDTGNAPTGPDTGTTTGPTPETSTSTTIGTEVLITYTTWPSTATIIPVTTSVDRPKSTHGGGVIPCKAWFFLFCISWGIDIIGGWEIPLPPGVYPGPPPGIKWPSGFKITGSLPPWPSITIGNDNIPTYSSEPTSCKTETASICSTTTSFGVSVSNSETVTTATSTASTCTTVAGCGEENETGSATITGACSTATVTDLWLSCSATATNDCQTASTYITSGCGATATTQRCTVAGATSTAGAISGRATGLPECNFPPSTYVVYPIDETNTEQTSRIRNELLKYASAADIYQSNTQTMGVNFWLLPLTDTQIIPAATQLVGLAASIYLQKRPKDPSTSITWQSNAPVDLIFVAQREGISLAEYSEDFFFDDTVDPGGQIPVHVLDTGALASHSVGQMVSPAKDDSQTDPANIIRSGGAHGTAMLSLITGKTLGVSKLVAPTIVRVPRRVIRQGAMGGATFEDYIEGLGKICDDLTTTSTVVKGLLLMSLAFPRDQFLRSGFDESAGFSGRMQALLANIITKGILPITGAGNLHENGIDAWPANFAGTANGASAALPELLVVGGVLTDSGTDGAGNGVRVYSYDTAKNLPHVYAPAYNVLVADDFAQTPIGLKNWIISQAWERKPGVPAIWSGVIPDDNACEWTPPALVKRGLDAIMARQAGAASSCGIPASLRSAIATDTIKQPGLTPTKTGVTSTTAPTTTTSNTPSTLSTVVCKTATAVPGQCGVPGCAYVKASDVGPDALCSADYCNCGGTAAPLLTVSATGTLTTNCDYTLQPTASSCPDETGAKTTTPPTTTAQRTTTAQPKPTPNTPLTLGSQHCNNADDFAGHGEIIPEIFDQLQAYGCVGSAVYRISATYNPMISMKALGTTLKSPGLKAV